MPSSTSSPAEKQEKPESAWSLARFFLTLIIFAWALRSLIIQPFNIPSGSMLPTLYIGDYLVVAKWPYGYSRYSFPFGFPSFGGRIFAQLPERGDVVVFRHPDERADLIKILSCRKIGFRCCSVTRTSKRRSNQSGGRFETPSIGAFVIPNQSNSDC